MPMTTNNLETQVESCRSLLDVFVKERQFYQDSDQISMDAVVRILQSKEKLVQVFEDQKAVSKAAAPAAGPASDRRQRLLRELGMLLEQLLVIDRENELLLRKLLGNAPATRPQTLGPSRPVVNPVQAMPRSRIRCYQKFNGKSASQRESHASYV